MNKKRFVFLILATLTITFIGKRLYDQKILNDLESNRLKAQNSIEGSRSTNDNQKETFDQNLDESLKKKEADIQNSLKVVSPTKEKLREEGAKNPHTTPSTLVQFSHQLGDKLGKASTTPQKISLFIELESCALGDNPESAQALCLLNARKLSQSEKKLEAPYQTLSQKVSPTVLKRIEGIP